jgi:hypothetical protein
MLSRNRCRTALSYLGAIAAIGTTVSPALADDCSALNLPHPIYGSGGSAVTADFAKVAKVLGNLSSPITILYNDALGACGGFGAFIGGKATGTFNYWKPDGTAATCTAALDGTPVTFSHMGNPASFCPNVTVPANVKEFPAPVQSLNVVTAAASTQPSISAEALFFIYGFGADAKYVLPWGTTAHVAQRQSTSFAQLLLADAIGVPAASFKAALPALDTQGKVLTAIADAATVSVEDPLGFVSGSAADAEEAKPAPRTKTLPFQAKGQTCGFLPDSAPKTADKINVRTGRYGLWAQGHFFTRINTTTHAIVDQDAANLIGWYNHTTDTPEGVDLQAQIIASGDIPLCAMQVQRAGLAGAISSYAPDEPCVHYFEKKATGATDGTLCTEAGNECPGKCHYGYCEAY